ncbi:hypothetical protein ACFQ0Q_31530 [Streptomyces aureus]
MLTSLRVVHDTAGKAPIRAEFQYVEGNGSDQRAVPLPVTGQITFALGPGQVDLSTRSAQDRELSWLTLPHSRTRPSGGPPSPPTPRSPASPRAFATVCPNAPCSCPVRTRTA